MSLGKNKEEKILKGIDVIRPIDNRRYRKSRLRSLIYGIFAFFHGILSVVFVRIFAATDETKNT